jgi:hypothetical protein
MLGIAHHLSTRIVSSRRLMARTVLVVVMAALLGATTAQADEPPASETTAGAPAETTSTEAPTSSTEATLSEGKVVSEGSKPEGAPEEATPHSETATEGSSPTTGETVSTTPPPTTSETPVAEAPAETPAPAAPEKTSEGTASETQSHSKDEKSAVVLPALPGAVPPSASAPAISAAEVAAVTSPGVPTGSMVIDLGDAQGGNEGSTGRDPSKAPANRPGGQGCELQGLGGASGGGCVGTWQRVTGALSPGDVSLSPVVAALGGATVASSTAVGDDQHGADGGGRSMPPAPGPAPGGASGVAAGGGGGGVGLAGFLAFGLLMALAAPRALRRLKLACLPWRTAFFVLIPERPG